jgi:hypothetical protein
MQSCISANSYSYSIYFLQHSSVSAPGKPANKIKVAADHQLNPMGYPAEPHGVAALELAPAVPRSLCSQSSEMSSLLALWIRDARAGVCEVRKKSETCLFTFVLSAAKEVTSQDQGWHGLKFVPGL